jgi:hypothetical protein
MVTLTAQEAKEVATYLRRVKPQGREEEHRVWFYVREFEDAD